MSLFSAFGKAGLSFVTKLGEIVAPLDDNEDDDEKNLDSKSSESPYPSDELGVSDEMHVRVSEIGNEGYSQREGLRVINHTPTIASGTLSGTYEDVLVDIGLTASLDVVELNEGTVEEYVPEDHNLQRDLSPSLMVDIELNDAKPVPISITTSSISNYSEALVESVATMQLQNENNRTEEQPLQQQHQHREQQRQAIMQESEEEEEEEEEEEKLKLANVMLTQSGNSTSSHPHSYSTSNSTNGGRECAEVRYENILPISSVAALFPIITAKSISPDIEGVFSPLVNDFPIYPSPSFVPAVPPVSLPSFGDKNVNPFRRQDIEYKQHQLEGQQVSQQDTNNLKKQISGDQYRENSLEFKSQDLIRSHNNHTLHPYNHQKEVLKEGYSEQPFWNILEKIDHKEKSILEEDLLKEQQLSSFLTNKIGEKVSRSEKMRRS